VTIQRQCLKKSDWNSKKAKAANAGWSLSFFPTLNRKLVSRERKVRCLTNRWYIGGIPVGPKFIVLTVNCWEVIVL
jgi:hypothetical protein